MSSRGASEVCYHLTLKSANRKTGVIPVSTSAASTCPGSCPLRQACYAKHGPMAIHWRKVSQGDRGVAFSEFLEQIAALPEGQLWRHNEAGDLPGAGDAIDAAALAQLVAANQGKRGFTYTHKPVLGNAKNAAAVQAANAAGFTVNLSADSAEEADQLQALRIAPVALVVPEDCHDSFKTPAGNQVAICPNARDARVTCKQCQLCQRSNRKAIIAFPVHGSGKKHFQG